MRLQRGIAMVLTLALILAGVHTGVMTASAAEGIEEVIATGTYGQSEARSMLPLINDFRTGNEAWYYADDTKNNKTYCTGLDELTYDYNLEQIAMQRAAEISVLFSHTRPDGSDWNTVTFNGTQTVGENIAYGGGSLMDTADEAFTIWREDDDGFSGQGHRRNMLDADFTAIGIGHFVVNGAHYWVQEFGFKNSGADATAPNDSGASNSGNVGEAETPAPGDVEITEVASGYCGATGNYRGISWKLTSDGKLTISGTGEMGYLSVPDKAQVTSVVIEDGVTSIYNRAFYDFSALTSITIPDSVTSIGNNAFARCSSLTSVVIPDGVTSISENMFDGCSSLTSVTIPDSVTSIGRIAFRGCSSLTDIVIPDSVTSIGGQAFEGCSSLTSVVIPDGVTSLSYVFISCSSLTSVTLPDSVTSLNNTFGGCTSLKSIDLPDNLTEIGFYTFYGCTALESITIPNSVTSIGERAFMECSALTDVVIPDSVTSIEHSAFNGCSALTSVKLPKVTTIEYMTFLNCTSLAQVTIPDSVKAIEYQAFGNCTNLSSVSFEGDAPEVTVRSTKMEWDDFYADPVDYVGSIFAGATATICYPLNNTTWTSEVKNRFGEGASLAWASGDSSLVIDRESMNVLKESYDPDSGKDITIRCEGELDKFEGVMVDGVNVAESNYTVQEGSTILTFKAAYLRTLSVGEHVITMNYETGNVEVVLNVKDTGDDEDDTPGQGTNATPTSPKTGEETNLWVWMAVVLAVSGTVLAGGKLRRTGRQ